MKSLLLLVLLLVMRGPLLGESVDGAFVDRAEDYSESLANQLHALSLAVREKKIDELASYFAAGLSAGGLPVRGDVAHPANKWTVAWNADWSSDGLDREAFVGEWRRYLGYFSAIEDVRFKVKQAHFIEGEAVQADAHIYFAIVGRDASGMRQWAEAEAWIEATLQPEGRWLLDAFELEKHGAHVALTELFSEVSLPAGMFRSAPRFGTPGNQDFLAHGVAVADIDRDGWLDALVTGVGRNFLYMNQGDGTFAERASAAGVQFTPPATGPLFLDSDNDGDVDLFLAAAGYQMLFENRPTEEGAPNLVDVSQEAGVAYPAQGFSAVAADVDQDGWSDIYVTSYNQYGTVMPNSWSRATNGTPNLLFVNRGDGTFTEQAESRGVADGRWSYAASFADLDEDGDQDLYVANDFGENGYYRNEGGYFTDRAEEVGLLDPGNGMGVSVGDFDNDGRLDLHVSNMSSTAGNRILSRLFPDGVKQLDETRVLNKLAAGNTLFRNLGSGSFEDASQAAGPFGAGWAFGGGFVDFDNDGWQDLHAPNGFISGKSLKDT
ncbi:MAG TPA: VCBS repeat-containing protein [Candidatus Latescibacteria bacterium]|jgi:hypothetical protein|nr:VCBS repeat-containing protein [Candidatus Handelsmanbacteria bacterium]HIL07817.1 VCBS repeat-containing protein [Candidatus Latescibacterota bacterium]